MVLGSPPGLTSTVGRGGSSKSSPSTLTDTGPFFLRAVEAIGAGVGVAYNSVHTYFHL